MMLPKVIGVATGYVSAGSLALLAQAPDASLFSSWLQYGALGILGGTTVGLFYVILRLLSGYKELADRWETWEKVRHNDSRETNETIRQLSTSCAAVNAGKSA
jgi:hypothetical protein